MDRKIPCGGLLERHDMCLVEVLGFTWRPGEACGILSRFADRGISLSYLSFGNGPDGDKNMSFCVRTDEMAANRTILEAIEEDFHPRRVAVRAPVVILTLYGPHFNDRPALVSQVFSGLCLEGVNTLTVCTSVNSISVVVETLDRDRTVSCLEQKFNWPD